MCTHLDVIGVELGARQAVERAEVQAPGEDAVRSAALSGISRKIIKVNWV